MRWERLGLGQKDEQGAAVGMEMVSEAAEGANRTKTVSEIQIDLGEYTINHQMDQILQDIYRRKPDVVGFSCYIWNIVYVKELIHDLKKVLPRSPHLAGRSGGSYDAVHLMDELPEDSLRASQIADGWSGIRASSILNNRLKRGTSVTARPVPRCGLCWNATMVPRHH